MPSGISCAIGRPSNSMRPSDAGRSPAISSRSVDLPQPEGPTIAKNSPLRIVRSIGPSACTAWPFARAGKRFVTPPSVTWSPHACRCAASLPPEGVQFAPRDGSPALMYACIDEVLLALDRRANVLGQEVGVDHLGDVDVPLE